MFAYAARRLVVAIPTIFIIITVAFFMMRAAPGNPFDRERPLPPEIRARVLAEYDLDKPVHIQYASYLGDLVRGDLGPSLTYRDKDVIDILREGAPVSAVVGFSSLAVAILVGSALGIAAALRQNRPSDFAVMAIALVGISVPPFVVGPILQLVFGLQLDWLPTAGLDRGRITVDRMILPVTTLALPQIANISRLMRASMIEVIRSNYIRTARAKGLSEPRVVLGHALRAAAPPLVSYLGPAAAALVTGSLVIEQVFGLPGIGRQFVIGALQRDYTVVMGVVILYSTLIILMNLLADLVLAWLDPKVRDQ
ncbi:MAG: ABC transporter permease subunit [Gammaproteobacteria bacterium]|nr:ABC transporter permease subunit [Gammaproteobacteria bacterium]